MGGNVGNAVDVFAVASGPGAPEEGARPAKAAPGFKARDGRPDGFFARLRESLGRETARESGTRTEGSARAAAPRRPGSAEATDPDAAEKIRREHVGSMKAARVRGEPDRPGASPSAPERADGPESQAGGKEVDAIADAAEDTENAQAAETEDEDLSPEEAQALLARLEDLLKRLDIDLEPGELRNPAFLRNLQAILEQEGGPDRLRALMAELQGTMVQRDQDPVPGLESQRFESNPRTSGADLRNPRGQSPASPGSALSMNPENEAELLEKARALLERLLAGKTAQSKDQPSSPMSTSVAPQADAGHPLAGLRAASSETNSAAGRSGLPTGMPAAIVHEGAAHPEVAVSREAAATMAPATPAAAEDPGDGERKADGSFRQGVEARHASPGGGFKDGAFEDPSQGRNEGFMRRSFLPEDGVRPGEGGFQSGIEVSSAAARAAEAEGAPARPGQHAAAEVFRQIAGRLQNLAFNGSDTVHIQLKPEHLGRVAIALEMLDGRLNARISVENESVRQMVDAGMVQLRESLEAQGLRVQNVEVTVSQHRFLLNPDGQNAQSFFQRQAPRRQGHGGLFREAAEETREGLDTGRRLGYNTLELIA